MKENIGHDTNQDNPEKDDIGDELFKLPTKARCEVKATIQPVESFAIQGVSGIYSLSDLDLTESDKMREWWHNFLRLYGRFYCYGVFLILQADGEAIKYLTDYAIEINQASGKNCAILGLSNVSDIVDNKFDVAQWNKAVTRQVNSGNSIKISELFHIPLTQFPSLILFRDVRSPEYVLINLKNLTALEIAHKMREIFQVIDESVSTKQDPLRAVRSFRQRADFKLKTHPIISGIRKITGQTLEMAIEAIIETAIKQ